MEFPAHRFAVSRRSLLALPLVAALPPPLARARQAATPVAGAADGWPVYGRDLADSRAVSAASIAVADVARLGPLWEAEVGGPVSATPVIAAGVAYVGAWDGRLDALDLATGARV